MAATGYTPIQLYRSGTASAVPNPANLTSGELAINYNASDMALYAKNSSGALRLLINNPYGLIYPTTDGTIGQVLTTNGSGVLSWSSTATGFINGTGTANYLARFNSSSSVTTSSIFDNGTYVGIGTNVVLGSAGTDTTTLNSQVSANSSVGTSGQVLTSRGSNLSPQWTSPNVSSGSSILYGNGSGGFSNVTVSTGLSFTTGTLTNSGILSVTGTASRVSVTAGQNPVVDLIASGVGVAGSVGSGTLIPVITYDTYGRITGVATAANPQGTVTSVNALTIGTTGSDITSTVASQTTTPTITLNIPTASATNRGALSTTDWSTFNNKVTSVSGTAPVSVTSGATPVVSMAPATSSVDGYLSSTDWSTFNSKQAALVSGTNIKTVNSTSLLGSGDVAVQAVLVSGTNIKTVNSTSLLGSGNVAVQDVLVSGTNIKTVNGVNILGSGNAAVGVTSITASTTPAFGLSLSGGTISTSGTIGITGTLAVPISNITATGTPSSTTFLAGDGTWSVPPGAGTITGVTTTGSAINGLSLTGGGTSGSVNVALTGTLSNVSLTTAVTGTLPVGNGGTGATTFTAGQYLKGNGTSAITSSATIPNTDITGLGTMSTQSASSVAITGGSITGITDLAVADGGTGASSFTAGHYLKGNGTSAITSSATVAAADLSGTVAVANGGTGATTLAGANIAVTNAANTFSAKQTFSGSTTALAALLTNCAEPITIVNSAISTPVAFYFNTQSILYYTVDATANWTVNFTHSSTPTTLDSVMSTGQAITAVVMVKQGATAFYNNAVQVDGSPVTPKWQGVAPNAGNANSTDVYTYTIIKTNTATFSVFASQTAFV